jgi:hypothetical protein
MKQQSFMQPQKYNPKYVFDAAPVHCIRPVNFNGKRGGRYSLLNHCLCQPNSDNSVYENQ